MTYIIILVAFVVAYIIYRVTHPVERVIYEEDHRNLIQRIIDGLPVAVFAKDVRGTYIFANRHAATRLGQENSQAVIGKIDFEMLPYDTATRLMNLDTRAYHEGSASSDVCIGGRTYHTRKIVLKDESGRKIGTAGFSTDVTERRHSAEVAEDTRRIEALGQLVRGIAHDFGHVLAINKGYLRHLERDLTRANERRRYTDAVADIQTMRENIEQGEALMKQLTDFARTGAVERKPLDLNTIIKGVKRLLHFPGVEMRYNLDISLPLVRGSQQEFKQVILNLALNARDAIPGEGWVKITTWSENDMVHLAVCDSGIGMDDDTRRQAFEPFFTTKAIGQGTGLGLATVYGIVERAEGYVAMDTSPGQGTTVTVTLPVASVT